MRKAIVLTILFGLVIASCSAQPRWVQLHPAHNPPALALSAYAYNIDSRQAVMFGGIDKTEWSDETWIWNGNDRQKANPPVRPGARGMAAMAYDESRNRMVLFGGRTDQQVYDDTWEWDGKGWKMLKPMHSPPARCCHAMAYDRVQQKVLLYAGWNKDTNTFFNDTWAWDGKDWEKLNDPHVATSAAHTLVDFASERKVVAVPAAEFATTWEWDGSAWNEIRSSPQPSRADGRSLYDPQNERVVLFGGIAKGEFLNDLWVFDGQVWNPLKTGNAPLARYGHVLFYDLQRRSIVLFGGAGKEGLLNDTWESKLP